MRLSPCEAPTRETSQTTTPGSACPNLLDKCVGSFNVPYLPCNIEDAGDGACGLKSLSEKT